MRRPKFFVALVALLGVATVVPAAAHAQETPHFGKRGQLFLQGSTGLSLGYNRTDIGSKGENGFAFGFSPSGGIFFADTAFVGLQLTGNIYGSKGIYDAYLGVGPAIGLRVTAGQRAHFAPSLAVLYDFVSLKNDAGEVVNVFNPNSPIGPNNTTHELALRLALPFVFELRHGLGLSLGPTLKQVVVNNMDASNIMRGTTVTVDLGLIGWM